MNLVLVAELGLPFVHSLARIGERCVFAPATQTMHGLHRILQRGDQCPHDLDAVVLIERLGGRLPDGGVLVAHIHPASQRDQFYLTEKFMGRLIAWFEKDLLAINVQFVPEPEKPARKKRKR